MTDRKSLDELFDFPTGRDAGPRRRADQQGLFDDAEEQAPVPDGSAEPSDAPPREPEPTDELLLDESPEDAIGPPPVEEPTPRRVGVAARLLAGAADLVFHATFLCVATLLMLPLGLEPELGQWPPLLLLLLCFSFLYVTLPLAFWGQTPGMAWQGLRARDREGLPLSFVQTALRWIWSVVTVGLAGLPLLVAFSGRSLVDRMSGSETLDDGRG